MHYAHEYETGLWIMVAEKTLERHTREVVCISFCGLLNCYDETYSCASVIFL